MTAAALIREARRRGIELLPGDRPGTVRYLAPSGTIDETFLNRLRRHKADIARALQDGQGAQGAHPWGHGHLEHLEHLDPAAGDRITLDDAAADLAVMHREIAAGWPAGAFAILDDDPDLRRRFAGAEQALDDLARVPGGPLRSEWTAAVGALAAVLREIVQRFTEGMSRADPARGGKQWQS